MHKTVPCLRCRRPLRAASHERTRYGQYGRACRAHIRRAAVAAAVRDFTAAQREKARLLIEDGALVPLRGSVFRVVSSDGQRRYLTHPATCNCPAGLHAARCYHSAAARMVAARKAA